MKPFISIFFQIIPNNKFFKIIRGLIISKLLKMDSKEKMKELLVFDNFLKNELAKSGVEYGSGTHIKHKITDYHSFFLNNINKNESVLDIGCGNAALTLSIFKKKKVRITGIEVDRKNFLSAKERVKNTKINLINADASSHKFDESYDVVILSNVLEHIRNRVSLLRRIKKEIKPKRVLLRVPVFKRDWTVLQKKRMGVEWRLDTTHFIEYTEEEFYNEIKKTGLKIKFIKFIWSEIWCVLA